MNKKEAMECVEYLQQLSRNLWQVHYTVTWVGVRANVIQWGRDGGPLGDVDYALREMQGDRSVEYPISEVKRYYELLKEKGCILDIVDIPLSGLPTSRIKDRIEKSVRNAEKDAEAMRVGGELASQMIMLGQKDDSAEKKLRAWLTEGGAGWDALAGESYGNKVAPDDLEPTDVVKWYLALQE